MGQIKGRKEEVCLGVIRQRGTEPGLGPHLLTPLLLSPHLQTPTGTVLREDTDVGGVSAGTHKPGQVFVLYIPHLQGEASIRSLAETSLLAKWPSTLRGLSVFSVPVHSLQTL